MNCPRCGSRTKVYDSRVISNGQTVRRMRKCPKCLFGFTTYETQPKKNGRIRK